MSPTRLVQSLGWMAFLGLLLIGGGYASYIANSQRLVQIISAHASQALPMPCMVSMTFNAMHRMTLTAVPPTK